MLTTALTDGDADTILPLESEDEEPTGETPTGRERPAFGPKSLNAFVEILAKWHGDRERSPLDRVVVGEIRQRNWLNAGERRRLSDALFYTVRFLRRQQFLLAQLNLPETPDNLAALYVTEFAPESSASQPEAQRIAPDRLQTALAALPTRDDALTYLAITESLSDPMSKEMLALLGDEALDAAHAFNQQAPTTLRLNPVRVSRSHALQTLPDLRPTRYSPWGLDLPRRQNLPEMHGYKQGWYEPQEEGSQLMALLTDARPGQAIVDVGAGGGGKTLAIGALLENKGEILAVDIRERSLKELQRRADRAGLTCVETVLTIADENGAWQPPATARRTLNRWRGKADAVLVDAPCTGSGTIRRSPDAKWREFAPDTLAHLQQTLLGEAAALVATGGFLVYVTCAWEPAQNEAIVDAFLATPLGALFTPVSCVERLQSVVGRAWEQAQMPPFLRTDKAQRKLADKPETVTTEKNSEDQPPTPALFADMASGLYLRTWPHRQGMDAFFAACLQRQTPESDPLAAPVAPEN